MSLPENTHEPVRVYIITVSDTRTEETDKSGLLIQSLLHENKHIVIGKAIVADDINKIQSTIKGLFENDEIDVILTNGGTGISKRDVTIEAIEPLLDKQIPGFGEIFRTLSYYEDIGSSSMMSRAIAGVSRHKGIFVMPGSSGAVKLAMHKLILPEIHHIKHEITKQL